MKISLAQIDVQAGKPKENVAKMLKYIETSKSQGVDIVSFSEMNVGGYLIGDLWLDDDYCRYLMSFNEQIIEATDGICVLWGNVFLDERESLRRQGTTQIIRNVHNDGRRRRFNAAYAYQNKKPLKHYRRCEAIPDGVQFKTLLPNYREFDDKRYFASNLDLIYSKFCDPLQAISPFEMESDKDGLIYYIGVQICEDIWDDDYDFKPTHYLKGSSDIIFNLSASPWTPNKVKSRDRRIRNAFNQNMNDDICYAYVNCVGVQNNGKNFFTFNGDSTVYLNGVPKITTKKPYEEELLVFDNESLPSGKLKRRKPKMIEQKYNAIVRGSKHLSEMLGIEKVVIGLSGGIDSAVVACILVEALGSKNVTAINMPSRYNSSKTKNAAEKVARRLGIEYRVIPIEEIDSVNRESILWYSKDAKNLDLLLENIQAKIRGTNILSNVAAATGAFFTNNGNKVETALGYATLYGDVGGAFSPIADCTKEEVYQLAWYINERFKKNPIPKDMLPNKYYQFSKGQIRPSAELKDNQVDPIKIGYHCKLIEQFMNYMKRSPLDIMTWYLNDELPKKLGMSPKLMKIYELDNPQKFLDDLEWFCKQIRGNVFKRVQSPPNIVVSKTAFGYDLRESILPWFRFTEEEQKLCQKILEKNDA